MKKLFFFLAMCLAVVLCIGCEWLGETCLLENVESSIEPSKESYSLSDSITLSYDCSPDFNEFEQYRFCIGIYPHGVSDENLTERVYDCILVLENEEDYTNREIMFDSDSLEEGAKISKTFQLIPKKTGIYEVYVWGWGIRKKSDNNDYEYSKCYLIKIIE